MMVNRGPGRGRFRIIGSSHGMKNLWLPAHRFRQGLLTCTASYPRSK